MNSFLGQCFISCFGFLLFAGTASAIACHPETPHTATAADAARASYNFAEAEKLYAKELKATPDSEEALAGYSISLLDEEKVPEALASAKRAVQQQPKSAALVAVLGEVEFRLANIKEAGAAFQSALALDPCSAQAHYATVRFLEANSMHVSARQQLEIAHQLAPQDPVIASRWQRSRPVSERVVYLKQRLMTGGLSEEERANLDYQVTYLEKQAEIDKAGGCHVVSSVKDVTQTMVPLGGGAYDVHAMGLDVRLNNTTAARLLFDTGASGVVVSKAVADHAGLKAFVKTSSFGFGDQADPTGYLAVVDDLRIGQLELKNCVVEVSDRHDIISHEGLLGGDVFRSFLITIDYPMKNIRFSQLPLRPGESASSETLKTIGEQSDIGQTLHDRYIAPEMKDWVRVLEMNHDLLIPTTVGDNQTHMFIIDTGAFSSLIDASLASRVTKVSKTDDIVEGVSGKVKDVRRGNSIFVQFGNMKARLDDATLLDLSRFSKADQFEIGGFVGFSALRFTVMQIDYRDGLVHFLYDRRQGFDQH